MNQQPENAQKPNQKTVAVLGATGYVGGRLVPLLLEAGYRVRAIGRSLNKLNDRPWASHPNAETVAADVKDVESLEKALTECGAVYYLVHSMNPGNKNFEQADRDAAHNMIKAAENAQVDRIIHLSGLGEDTPDLSQHLRSRAEVANILKRSKLPVTILRAAMIIGSGSASFEILRYLVERLPLMITPQWVRTPSQPIAIRNVMNYLKGCLEVSETENRTFDIGGTEVHSYEELMRIYAEEAQLPKRWILPIPFFTPRLSSYWIHLVTPIPASLGRPLAEGLKNPAVCKEHSIQDLIPQDLMSCREAIRLALQHVQAHTVVSHWTDAGILPPVESVFPGDPNWSGGAVYQDRRSIVVEGTPEQLWQQVIQIGGKSGWYYGNTLWRMRGAMDRMVGGVGDRRGRRDPSKLYRGDALDVWRVLDIFKLRKLTLLAEMKMPGIAVLDFDIENVGEPPTDNQRSQQLRLTQTAWFASRGLSGVLYWYAVMPFHNFIFNGMLRGIAKSANLVVVEGPTKEPYQEQATPSTHNALAGNA